MWRSILAVAVLGSVAHAQMMAVTADIQTAPDRLSPLTNPSESEISQPRPQSAGQPTIKGNPPPSIPVVSYYKRHNRLRRERDEELVVLACDPAPRGSNCPLLPFNNRAKVLPLALTLIPAEGFKVRFRQGDEFRIQQQGTPVQTRTGLNVFRLKIRAGGNVSLGEHIMQGKLTVRTINADGSSQVQELPVNIALHVVEHDAQVVEAHWSLDNRKHYNIGQTVEMVVLAPFWVPLFLAFLISCEFEHCD